MPAPHVYTPVPAGDGSPEVVVATPGATVQKTWTVAPGDCFWTIAEDVLTQAWGRSPTNAEIVPYWQVLIEANRSALVDPANPDLIYPSQQFEVPPPPPADVTG